MVSNTIRSRKTLPLDTAAWIEAYKPLSNWPVKKWLQFQRPEGGCLQDALTVLHDFQKEFNLRDESAQRDMLTWLQSSAVWDRTSLTSWGAWNTLLSSTPMWSLPVQAHLMGHHAKGLLRVEPQQFADIAKVQEHLGRYWNSVQSRIPIPVDYQRGRGFTNTSGEHSQWETYNTFRRELKSGVLLDHPHNTRWVDFTRLSQAPAAWREVLVPLYQQWLAELAPTVRIEHTNFQTWLNTFEQNKLDPSQVALPVFDDPQDYGCWSVPRAWEDSTPEQTFNKILYLDKAARLYLDDLSSEEYPSQTLNWINAQCMRCAGDWPLEKKLEINDLFLLSVSKNGDGYYVRDARTREAVHKIFLQWLPEYAPQFTSLRESMDVLGIDYREVTIGWNGLPKAEYTHKSAQQEMVHYATMIRHLLDPTIAGPNENIGHLFDSDDDALLGI